MIVVLASEQDEVARLLVQKWGGRNACVLTPTSLSRSGWRFYMGSRTKCDAVLANGQIDCREITGVVTRLAAVTENDLPHIEARDRSYVAAEMTAFLLAWLSSLECPVINRPTPGGLNGPAWREEEWRYCAAKIGIPIIPMRRTVNKSDTTSSLVPHPAEFQVTLIGDRCFGSSDSPAVSFTRLLAATSAVDLLEVDYSGTPSEPRFVRARVCPLSLLDDAADTLLEVLQNRRVPELEPVEDA